MFEYLYSFHEGLAAAVENEKIGYIDIKGNYVIKPQFAEANSFSNGLAAVKRGGKWFYIDKNGKTKIRLSRAIEQALDFSEGFAVIEQNDGKCGYIDANGNKIIPLKYNSCDDFSEGLANVRHGQRWIYINEKGQMVFETPTDYFRTYPFKDGLAKIDVGQVGPDQRFGYIDKQGKEIWKPLPAIISK